MYRKLAGLMVLVSFSSLISAQNRTASGQLEVTATVVSSSLLLEQSDGSFRLVVVNAPGQKDVMDLQAAINRASSPQESREVATVALVPPVKQASCKRPHCLRKIEQRGIGHRNRTLSPQK